MIQGDVKQKFKNDFTSVTVSKEKGLSFLKNRKGLISLRELKANNLKVTSAYQHKGDNAPLFPTNTVRVKLKPGFNFKSVTDFISQTEYSQVHEKYGVIRIQVKEIDNVLKIANKIYESGMAEFAMPDFVIELEINQVNDPLFPLQYQMNNTGQIVDGVAGINDIDCNAFDSWDFTLGENITVAVVDQGLEEHEDIGGRLVGGFTPANNGNGTPILNDDTHGMNCAGVIGASDNNIGLRGVAPDVDFLSVNIFANGTSFGDMADGLIWAMNNGADIISNSWSYRGRPCGFTNADVDNAIQNVVTNGRNGLGCIVVFSAGNDNTFTNGCVSSPSINPNVITVGATDHQGNLYGYSRTGTEVDLVAPSGLRFFVAGETTVGVRTLDRMGAAGDFPGNYRDNFDGTSAACPVVSGTAALMLSVNPNLTQQEVRDILTCTATDMGANGFDNNFGFGRVNALAAVEQAGYEIIGEDAVCTFRNYSVPNYNGTITWSLSPTGIASVNSTGRVSRIGSNSGVIILSALLNDNCNRTITRQISIGSTEDPENVWGYMDNFDDIRAYVDEVVGATEYRWYLNGAYIQSSTTPYTVLPEPAPCQGWDEVHLLEVEAVNACGTSDNDGAWVDDERCDYGYARAGGLIYPNPAKSQVTIDMSKAEFETTRLNNQSQLYKIVITNQTGYIVQQLETLNQQTVVDVSDLRTGAYFVIIQSGRELVRQTLIIE